MDEHGKPDGSDFDAQPARECLPTDQMRKMFDAWVSARGDDALPPANAIDPTRLPRDCLPYLTIIEVTHAPMRLRSRLVGTAMVEALGIDQTGQYLDDIPGMGTEQMKRFEWCVKERKPYYAEGRLTFSPRDYKRYQALALPYAGDDGRVSRLLYVFGFPSSDTSPDDGD
jgi:hypothetical protein